VMSVFLSTVSTIVTINFLFEDITVCNLCCHSLFARHRRRVIVHWFPGFASENQ
jgi:hypothetical protein